VVYLVVFAVQQNYTVSFTVHLSYLNRCHR